MIAGNLLRAVGFHGDIYLRCSCQAVTSHAKYVTNTSARSNEPKEFKTEPKPRHSRRLWSEKKLFFEMQYDEGPNLTRLLSESESSLLDRHPETETQVTIPVGYNGVDTWESIVETTMLNVHYTRNCVQKEIMEFLINRMHSNIAPVSELESLMQSYLDFLFNHPPALEVGQVAITSYLRRCQHQKQTEHINALLPKLKSKIKVFGPKLLIRILQCEFPNDENKKDLVQHFGYHASILNNKQVKWHGIKFLLRNDEKLHGVKLLREYLDLYEQSSICSVNHDVLQVFLDTFSFTEDKRQWEENRHVVENFLLYLGQSNQHFFNEPKLLIEWFKNIKDETWSATTFLAEEIRNQHCPITDIRLTSSVLTKAEHTQLHNGLRTMLLQQKKSHMTSSRRNIGDFVEFLNKNGPFDLVLDGLNIFYACKIKEHAMKAIYQAIAKYRQRKKNAKVLFVARKHLQKTLEMSELDYADNVKVYLVDGNVADDSYLLYATLFSGNNCRFISNDFYRNYRNLINTEFGPKMTKLFEKFQISRQISFTVHPSMRFFFGSDIFAEVQTTGDTWHFPFYRLDEDKNQPQSREQPMCFLCLRREDKQEQSNSVMER